MKKVKREGLTTTGEGGVEVNQTKRIRKLEKVLREVIRHERGEHHPNCNTTYGYGGKCDCYAGDSDAAHAALDELVGFALGTTPPPPPSTPPPAPRPPRA